MSTDRSVVVVRRDTERQRTMFWDCAVNRFTYYEEHATVFACEADARTYVKYAGVTGEIRLATEAAVQD